MFNRQTAFNQGDTPDKLIQDALNAKRINAYSIDRAAPLKQNILERAEGQLARRFSPSKKATIEDAELIAKVCLALSYIRPNWTDCSDFFQLILMTSIHRYNPMMSVKDAKCILHTLAHMGVPKHWSSSMIGLNQKEIIKPLLRVIEQNIEYCDEQMHANILWDMAVLDLDETDIEILAIKIMNAILASYNKTNNLSQYNDLEIKQLSDFFANYSSRISAESLPQIQPIIHCCNMRIKEIIADEPTSSQLHLDIIQMIKKCSNIPFESEKLIAGGYADICFPEQKKVFEINGPQHYDKHGHLNAKSLFRQRIMEKCGYPVQHIYYQDWDNADNKKEFIIRLLTSCQIPTREITPALTITIHNHATPVIINMPSVTFYAIPRANLTQDERGEKRKYEKINDEDKNQTSAKSQRKD